MMFLAVVSSATIGAVAGFLLCHFLDNRHFEEMKKIYDDYVEAIKAEDKRYEAELHNIINRYQNLLAEKSIPKKVMRKRNSDIDFFSDLSVSNDGWEDVDFGGNF